MQSNYRSNLEATIAKQLHSSAILFEYEKTKLKFTQPAKARTYTPDFILPNKIIIEAKGIFDKEDRDKHLWVREAHPYLDIRFVFSSSKTKIRKGSPTTYADWCRANYFMFADKLIPYEWLLE